VVVGDRWCCLNSNKTPNETPIAAIFYSNDGGWSSTNGNDGGLGEREGEMPLQQRR
jgi:hypothetical protein